MNTELQQKNLSLMSLILRLAIGSLFLGTAIIKVKGGIDGSITYYMSMFDKSIFPIPLVKFHASIIMLVEFILGAWLLSGVKLREAWIASAVTFITLAFGMIFVYKFEVVSDNYIYVVISIIGLYLSEFDEYRLKK